MRRHRNRAEKAEQEGDGNPNTAALEAQDCPIRSRKSTQVHAVFEYLDSPSYAAPSPTIFIVPGGSVPAAWR